MALTPPSPWIGSTRTAATVSSIAARRASWSPQGRWTKPGINGPNPPVIFSPPAAAIAPVERPWNAPSKVRIVSRGAPRSKWWRRAILMASSHASVPELQKNTVSAKVSATSRSASSRCGPIS